MDYLLSDPNYSVLQNTLRAWQNDAALAASPLASLALVEMSRREQSNTIDALRTMLLDAIKQLLGQAQDDPDVDTIWLNRSLSTITGHATSDRRRPDITIRYRNGDYQVNEVVSPSQTGSQMHQKLDSMEDSIRDAGLNVRPGEVVDPDFTG